MIEVGSPVVGSLSADWLDFAVKFHQSNLVSVSLRSAHAWNSFLAGGIK
jgi:hypothetical protein